MASQALHQSRKGRRVGLAVLGVAGLSLAVRRAAHARAARRRRPASRSSPRCQTTAITVDATPPATRRLAPVGYKVDLGRRSRASTPPAPGKARQGRPARHRRQPRRHRHDGRRRTSPRRRDVALAVGHGLPTWRSSPSSSPADRGAEPPRRRTGGRERPGTSHDRPAATLASAGGALPTGAFWVVVAARRRLVPLADEPRRVHDPDDRVRPLDGPTYHTGDLVVARCGPAEVGDVVVYQPPDMGGVRIIHRIVGGDGRRRLGGAGRQQRLDRPVDARSGDEVLGVARVHVGGAGALSTLFLSPVVWVSLILVAAGILVLAGATRTTRAGRPTSSPEPAVVP